MKEKCQIETQRNVLRSNERKDSCWALSKTGPAQCAIQVWPLFSSVSYSLDGSINLQWNTTLTTACLLDWMCERNWGRGKWEKRTKLKDWLPPTRDCTHIGATFYLDQRFAKTHFKWRGSKLTDRQTGSFGISREVTLSKLTWLFRPVPSHFWLQNNFKAKWLPDRKASETGWLFVGQTWS